MFIKALATIGKTVLKFTAIGAMSTAQHGLRNSTTSMMNDINGQIGRGYNYYVQPSIDKGLTLVKGGRK